MSNAQPSRFDNADAEMLLKHCLQFFRANWFFIFAGVLLGGGFACYIALKAPRQYEAVGVIREIITSRRPPLNNTDMQAELAEIIMWLGQDTAYDVPTKQACGWEVEIAQGLPPAKIVKADVPNASLGLLQLRVRKTDPAVATQCVNAVFEMIKQRQAAFPAPHIAEAREQIANFDQRIATFQADLKDAGKTRPLADFYLVNRDQVIFWMNQSEEWKRRLAIYQAQKTTLIAPVATPTPIPRGGVFKLVLGCVLGLIAGMAFALLRQSLRSNKN